MGKATEVSDYLRTRPLSAAEIREREAALASGGRAEATLDGTLVKPATPTAAPQEFFTAPQETWD